MEQKKAWNDILNPKFLGSWDIPQNGTLILQIQKAVSEEVDNYRTNKKEQKMIVYFNGNYKPMVCNITNSKAISAALKSKYLDDWTGKFIEICTKEIRAFGENTQALRVKDKAPITPTKTKENFSPDHPKWLAGIEAIKTGKTTLESVKQSYNLTHENELLLCENLK